MRRILSLSVCLVAAGAVSACRGPDEVIATEDIPTAGVRFLNALPDSAGALGLDLRFVDIVESNAHFRITFRNNPVTSSGVPASTQVQYKNARAGQRHFVVFLDDTLQAAASTKLADTTATFEAGKLYSVILWGYARPGSVPAKKLTILEESVADPGTQVALRVMNMTGSAIDVRHYVSGTAVPGAATWANVAPLSASTYVTVATGQYRYNVQPAGGGAVLFADPLALLGTAATVDIEALPGTTVAGSAVTLMVFPPSVVGSRTPQTAAFQVPAGSFMWDRRPPR